MEWGFESRPRPVRPPVKMRGKYHGLGLALKFVVEPPKTWWDCARLPSTSDANCDSCENHNSRAKVGVSRKPVGSIFEHPYQFFFHPLNRGTRLRKRNYPLTHRKRTRTQTSRSFPTSNFTQSSSLSPRFTRSFSFHFKIPNLWFTPSNRGRQADPPHPPVLSIGIK